MKRNKLSQLSLIRTIYRNLINNSRSYAAFREKKILPYVERLSDRGEILDPMSGYGSLMSYCSKLGIKSFCLEFSIPMYLWQILNHPAYTGVFQGSIEQLMSMKRSWPKTELMAEASEECFPEGSKCIITELLYLTKRIVSSFKVDSEKIELFSLAILLPFVGRLSSTVPGNVPTEVKKGGICVYKDFQKDFSEYLEIICDRLQDVKSASKSNRHTVVLGDCPIFLR